MGRSAVKKEKKPFLANRWGRYVLFRTNQTKRDFEKLSKLELKWKKEAIWHIKTKYPPLKQLLCKQEND